MACAAEATHIDDKHTPRDPVVGIQVTCRRHGHESLHHFRMAPLPRDRRVGVEVGRDKGAIVFREGDRGRNLFQSRCPIADIGAGRKEHAVEIFLGMGDQQLSLGELAFDADAAHAVADHRKALPLAFVDEGLEDLR